jgi:tripartite-type tricarboxylate transporter receptor subunit TctC
MFKSRTLMALAVAAMVGGACAPAAPPSPTSAPAKPAATTAPAKPTEAPAAKPAEAKPAASPEAKAEAKPAASPAAKPAEAKPAASPAAAAKPAEAKPAASPAAKPTFDEKAVADFYRGKTVRIVLGLAAGAGADLTARLLARHIPKYIPGNPSVIVENRPGAGGLLAANTVYAAEPKDGTVIGAVLEGHPLQQALAAPGIEFDATKFQWIGSLIKTPGACMARTDTGINTIQDLITGGKELIVATSGPGSTPHDIPAVLMEATGAKFKLIPGYPGGAPSLQAVESKEVDGYCVSLSAMLTTATRLLEGSPPQAKIIVVTGARTPDHPLLRGVPAAEPLAKSEEGRQLLRAVGAPGEMTRPFAFAPGVPADRVAAMRHAFNQTMTDRDFRDEAQKAQVELSPSTGEEVERTVQAMLGLPQPTLDKLKTVLR